jgi:hypothetical protein
MNDATEVVVLTVSESKRLIAMATVSLPLVRRALEWGMVAVAKGTTNAYVVEELLGTRIDRSTYVLGKTLPQKLEPLLALPEVAKDFVLNKGTQVDVSVVDAVKLMSEGDVFIKGGNVLDYSSGLVGILMGAPGGGTIGRTIQTIKRNKVGLVLPVGLEKSVSTDIRLVQRELQKGASWHNAPLRLMIVTGTIITEIEALQIMTGINAMQISAGGIGGAEGSVRLLLNGSEDRLQSARELIHVIQGEPPFLESAAR